MTIRFRCEPRRTVKPEDFLEYGERNIALDGYVSGPPWVNTSRRIANANHHEGVNTMATRSTCDQIFILVVLGLFKTFQVDGKPDVTAWFNDIDLDVVLATYVLKHPQHVKRPKLRDLIRTEDLTDMSAGLWPTKRRHHLMRQLNWIGQPYSEARMSGRLEKMDGDEMLELLDEMHRRVRAILFGRIKELEPDTRYEVMSRHQGWVMLREIGYQARVAMVEDGIKAFVSYRGKNPKGNHVFSIGRQSELIPDLPMPKVYDWLNWAEGISDNAVDRWGGSVTHGGSPRDRGSKLTPKQVALVADAANKESGSRDKRRALNKMKEAGFTGSN